MCQVVSHIVPVIYNVESATSTKDGNGKVSLHGIGLASHVKVQFGDVEMGGKVKVYDIGLANYINVQFIDVKVTPKEVADDRRSMNIVVPRVSSERRISISAKNNNGLLPVICFQVSKKGKLARKELEVKRAPCY